MEAVILETKRRIVRSLVSKENGDAPLCKSFVYINCPNCNKRLIQAKASKKTKTFTVDRQHPADSADMTIKCERCKSIVAIAK